MIYFTKSRLWERFTTRRERTTDNLEEHKGEVRTAVRTGSDSAQVTVSLAETTHQPKPEAARIRRIRQKNTMRRDKKKAAKQSNIQSDESTSSLPTWARSHSLHSYHHHLDASESDGSTTAASTRMIKTKKATKKSGFDESTSSLPTRSSRSASDSEAAMTADWTRSLAADLPPALVLWPPALRPEWMLLNMHKTRMMEMDPNDIICPFEEDFESKDWGKWCAEFDIHEESVLLAELIMRLAYSRLLKLWTGARLAECNDACKFYFEKHGVYAGVWVLEQEMKGFGREMKRTVDAVGILISGASGSEECWRAIKSAVDGLLELYKQRRRENPVGALTTCTKCKMVIKNTKEKNNLNCAACGQVAYCGKACQKADWKVHKEYCQLFQKKLSHLKYCGRLQEGSSPRVDSELSKV